MSTLNNEFGCDCLDKLQSMLLDKFREESKPTLDVYPCINFKTGVTFYSTGHLNASYWLMKKDGSVSKRRQKTRIHFSYCPFCGVKKQKGIS